MKLIVGLGNPGKKYEGTRHNVGFYVVDYLVGGVKWGESRKGKLQYVWLGEGKGKVEFVKPQTFMNDSGEAVAYVLNKHKEISPDDLFVIHDDLDIAIGEFKIQKKKGPRDHKGLHSIYSKIGTKGFWHVRVGIENRNLGNGPQESDHRKRIPGEDYVLMKFSKQEIDKLAHVVNLISDSLKADFGLSFRDTMD